MEENTNGNYLRYIPTIRLLNVVQTVFLSLECDPIETYCQKKPPKTWLEVANSHFSMCLCHHLETYLGSVCF